MNMISWTSLAVLISSVFGVFSVYQAEEGDNITIKWDSPIQTDMSLTNMMCVFQSKPPKVLYKMIRGVEDSESQHEQFAGRVQIDRDALRGGRIRLHLSRVTAEDSGNYNCDLAANYNKVLKRWELETSENFVLNVSQTSGDSDVSLKSPTSESEITEGGPEHKTRLFLVSVVLTAAVILAAVVAASFCRSQHQQDQSPNGSSGTELLTIQQTNISTSEMAPVENEHGRNKRTVG